MTQLKQYEILLPQQDNAGNSTAPQREAFELFLLNGFNGFTRGASLHGGWKNDAGQIFFDALVPYRVACVDFFPVLARAFELFPDQEALYYTCGADAFIVPRKVPIEGWPHDRGFPK